MGKEYAFVRAYLVGLIFILVFLFASMKISNYYTHSTKSQMIYTHKKGRTAGIPLLLS